MININPDCARVIRSYLPPLDLAVTSRVSRKWHDAACREAQERSRKQGFGNRSRETALKDLQVTQYYPEGVVKAVGLDRILNGPQLQPAQLNRIFKGIDVYVNQHRVCSFDIGRHPGPLAWGKDSDGKRFLFFHMQEKNDLPTCKGVATCNIWQPIKGHFLAKMGDSFSSWHHMWDTPPFSSHVKEVVDPKMLEAIRQIFTDTHPTLRSYSGLDFPKSLIEAIGLPRIRNSPYRQGLLHYKYSSPIADHPLLWGRNEYNDPCISFYIQSKEDSSKFIQYWVWKSRLFNHLAQRHEAGPFFGQGYSCVVEDFVGMGYRCVVDKYQMQKEFSPFCDCTRLTNPELLASIEQIFAGTHKTLQLYSNQSKE